MTVLEIFKAIEDSGAGVALRDSEWLFPVIESIHLLGLSVLGGAVLLLDMRMMGYGLKTTPLSEIANDTKPYRFWSLMTMLVTGFFLFASEATKCYSNAAFWFKMCSLAAAILFTWTIQAKVVAAKEEATSPGTLKLVAIVSVLLWSGVGIGGRWIGFS